MKENRRKWFKAGIASALILMLTFSAAGANNQTIEFEAFEGTVDSNGDVVTGENNIEGYSAVVYNFETDSFDNATSFYTKKDTDSSKITLKFNISDTKERNYGIYFYKRNNNGEDEYITYEYTVELNKTGENLDEINSTHYSERIYFTRKTGAESNIRIDQFDELVAGEPVTVGVDIEVDAPIDQTYVTKYTPNNEFGEVDLTDFYRTDVEYTLEAINLSDESNTTVESLTDTVSLDFGGSKYLEFTTIDSTGVYNITGETDPTVDLKVESGTNDVDSEKVEYLSKIKTNIPSASNEYVRDKAKALVNLKDNLPAIEANIAKSIEYSWLNRLTDQTSIDKVRGSEGLDAVDSADKRNYTVEDSGDLPATLEQPENGDWYLCLRAWVKDGRSIITKGETDCRHFMVDNQDPIYESVNSPTGTVTYKESGFYFNTTVSDNIQLEQVNLSVDGALRDVEDSFTRPSGSNDISNLVHLGEGSHNYEWRARDKVMLENGLTPARSSGSITVNPLAPQLGFEIQNTTKGNSLTQAYWNDTVRLKATTQTMYAPLEFTSNLTGWKEPKGEQGSFTEDLTLDKIGTFSFEATAGHGNDNYTEESVSSTVKVKEIPTDADITLLDVNGDEISSAGLMETVTVRVDPQADLKNSKAPVKATSNLTLSAWNEINDNGVYETDIQMKEEGTFEFNMTAGDTGENSEGFTNSSDSETLTVSADNGGDETLEWNRTIQEQEIHVSESFSYGLEVNYTGTASDLTWNVLNDNFTVSTGSSKENATVEKSGALEVGAYEVPVEVYDGAGNYISETFGVNVNPDLYWGSQVSDQAIEEGESYSRNLSEYVSYIGDKKDLKWDITQNEDLFDVKDGVVENTEALDPGAYMISVNLTGSDVDEVETSYELQVNAASDGGSGGSDGGPSGGFAVAPSMEKELEIELDPSKLKEGETALLSGNLTNSEGDENITVTLNGTEVDNVQVSSEGKFSSTLKPESAGNLTVKASVSSLSATKNLQVLEDFDIEKVSYPEVVATGEEFQICVDIGKPAEIRLFKNEKQVINRTDDSLCVNRTLNLSGIYNYKFLASADGETIQESFDIKAGETDEETMEDREQDEEVVESGDTDDSDSLSFSRITGAFSQSVSSTEGKVGVSVLVGLILTTLILLSKMGFRSQISSLFSS